MRFAGILRDEMPPKVDAETHADLIWLVEHPGQIMFGKYHDSGALWHLIEAALVEIRTLRKELTRLRQVRSKGQRA
jgi:hypothetical protein